VTPHQGMVWGIGLNRTGTSSLAHALFALGYPNLHYPNARRMLAEDWSIFDGWRGGSDLPVAGMYQTLDRAFPGSKFVLTVRDMDDWLRSIVRHFEGVPRSMDRDVSATFRERVYGRARPTPDLFAAAYERHKGEVVRSFVDRPGDLLVMDITAGDGWERLCPFLGLAIPERPFPNANRADKQDTGGVPEAIRWHRAVAGAGAQ